MVQVTMCCARGVGVPLGRRVESARAVPTAVDISLNQSGLAISTVYSESAVGATVEYNGGYESVLVTFQARSCTVEVASLVVGVLASIASIAFGLTIIHSRILWLILLMTSLYTLTFILKFDATAAVLSGITVLRSIVFLIGFKHPRPWMEPGRMKWVIIIVSVAAWFLTTDFTTLVWTNFLMLVLPIVVAVAMSSRSIAVGKWLMLVSAIGWTVYEVATGAYGLLPGEIFSGIALIIALVRLGAIRRAERLAGAGVVVTLPDVVFAEGVILDDGERTEDVHNTAVLPVVVLNQ